MTNRGRPIGAEIRLACTVLSSHGACTGEQLAKASGIARNRINKLMARAESYGLVDADGSYPRVFAVVTDWHSRIGAPRAKPAKPAAPPQTVPRVSSVWDLGQRI